MTFHHDLGELGRKPGRPAICFARVMHFIRVRLYLGFGANLTVLAEKVSCEDRSVATQSLLSKHEMQIEDSPLPLVI